MEPGTGSHAPASFEPAFRRLQSVISQDDARLFESTTIKDVWDAAKQIERQLSQRKSLRGMQRIRPFLSGIEQFAGVIEVLCQGELSPQYSRVCDRWL